MSDSLESTGTNPNGIICRESSTNTLNQLLTINFTAPEALIVSNVLSYM